MNRYHYTCGILIIALLSVQLSFSSESQTFKCEFIDQSQFSSCLSSNTSDIAFYASGNIDADNIFNSKVSLHNQTPSGVDYTKALCCRSDFDDVKIEFKNKLGGASCGEDNEFEFAFLQSEYNSKLRLEPDSNYDISICLKSDERFADLDIKIDEIDSGFDAVGYSCLYRFGSGYSDATTYKHNGKVSSCNTDITTYGKYPFAVFARLVQNIGSLICNNDCTSELDNRIYSACEDKIQSCSSIPLQCDGSLNGAWVNFDSTREVKCKKPFNEFRQKSSTNAQLLVETDSDTCENVIVKKYNVLLNQQTVSMNIYVCGDN